jgi:putative transposase
MDFVSDSLSSGRRLKYLTVADDFSHECVDIAVDYGISGLSPHTPLIRMI